MGNATLRTVASRTKLVDDASREVAIDITMGSLDVELEIEDAGQRSLESLVPGAPVEIPSRVMGGSHLAPGTKDEVTAARGYPELECNGIAYGPATIVNPSGGGTHPILKLGQVIRIRVG